MKSKKLNTVIGISGALLTLGLTAATMGTVFAQTTPSTARQAVMHSMSQRLMMQNVQRSVQNISNGAQITLTSTDAATVQKLQSIKHSGPVQNDKIAVTQTSIDNGVQLTITSSDTAEVTRIQEKAQNGRGFGFGSPRRGRGGMHGGRGMMFGQNVTRSVQNISNGVQVTLTSTDAATVKNLQSFKQPGAPKDAKVTVTKTDVTNGVQLTITSTDAAKVEKIQQRELRHLQKAQASTRQAGTSDTDTNSIL